MGRASSYTEEAAEEICQRLSEGEPLRQICRDSHMPGWVTVYAWMGERPDFAERIARARVLGQDAIAEQCLHIADDAGEDPQRSRLRVDTRLKLLAKWNPKRYGDKLELAGDKERPLNITVRKLSDG